MQTLVSPDAQLSWLQRTASQFVSGAYGMTKVSAYEVNRYYKTMDRFIFDDRQRGEHVLVCVLAGYKPDLWDIVMPRLEAALPVADVCIVSPGMMSPELSTLSAKRGWSYLSTATNDVSLAQNICYAHHRSAQMIIKVDEDMILLPQSIKQLINAFFAIQEEGVYDPGILAPMIPLNGFCYRHVLQRLDLLDDYERIFGPARLATAGIPVQNDPYAARWIWERTAPLMTTAAVIAADGPQTLACPIQFSIGLIAFQRSFWEQADYLPVHRRRLFAGISTLGADEEHLCKHALRAARPVLVTTTSFAGHFAFGPQYRSQLDLLKQNHDLFA